MSTSDSLPPFSSSLSGLSSGPPEEELDSSSPFPSYFNESPVTVDTSTSSVVIFDHLPKVEVSRYEKLVSVLMKHFSAFGRIVTKSFYLPVGEVDGKNFTLGYAFVEYETAEDAMRAVQEGNGFTLDKAHVVAVTSFDDFQRLMKMKDEWEPPKRSEFEHKAQLNSWLLDEQGRDQFVVRAGVDTHIYWNDPYRKANEYGRTYHYGGHYLITFHRPGIAFWGGDQFEKLGRVPHDSVLNLEFSPCERFVVTTNDLEKGHKNDPDPIIVWDVRTFKKLRGFDMLKPDAVVVPPGLPGVKPEEDKQVSRELWPYFRWSHDGSYLARISKDTISVYTTPDMGLLEKKSLKVPGVVDFCWSPVSPLLAYWIPAAAVGRDQPARVAIVELPSRDIVREKHVYNVVDIRMHWHDQGDYLCIRLTRKKSKNTFTNHFEIFRLREKDIPIEVVDSDVIITQFAWEPNGTRFAVITGEGGKTQVSIYSVLGSQVRKQHSFDMNKSVNGLFWSPVGSILLVAGYGPGFSGSLEWIDADAGESLAVNEHFNCNDIEWDPSGRFLMTAVTKPIEPNAGYRYSAQDNGYRLWSMQGQLLVAMPLEDAYQVLWRPRPKNILTREQLGEIQRTLKEKYWRKFEFEDDEIRRSQLQGRDKERAELRAQWRQFRAEKDAEYAAQAEQRHKLRGYDSENEEAEYITVEREIEEEISRDEEVLA